LNTSYEQSRSIREGDREEGLSKRVESREEEVDKKTGSECQVQNCNRSKAKKEEEYETDTEEA
jgi:hypothetical protein